MAIDILRDEDGDVLITSTGIKHGESEMQELALILVLNPGDIKHFPVLGPALTRFVKSNGGREKIESAIAMHLKLDGKNYNELKNKIRTNR